MRKLTAKQKKRRQRIIRRRRITVLFILVLIVLGGIELTKFILNKKNTLTANKPETSSSKTPDLETKTSQSTITPETSVPDSTVTAETKTLSAVEETSTATASLHTAAFVSSYLTTGTTEEEINNTKIAYLTFDDGPSQTVTPKILEVLKEKNVKATFFVLGNQLESSDAAKELLKKIHSEGHTIGNHTYSHDYSYLYPNRSANAENIMSDIEKTNSIIRQVLGDNININSVRLPGGHMSWNNLQDTDSAFSEKGYYSIDWNALNGDAEGVKRTSAELVQRAKETIGTNSPVVILMHDTYGKEETAKALPEIIDYLKEQGYEFHNII